MRHVKLFKFKCCCCGAKKTERANSLCHARASLHGRGWASTSMTSKSSQDICDICLPKHPTYEPGRPFKQSLFAELFQLEGSK